MMIPDWRPPYSERRRIQSGVDMPVPRSKGLHSGSQWQVTSGPTNRSTRPKSQTVGCDSMCGICGFTGAPSRELLRQMTDSLFHRGPDDSGYYEDDELALGVRRLSIIDVQGGHQPL